MSSDWLHISPMSGSGDTQLTIRAEDNPSGIERRARIIITAGTLTKTIEVVQGLAECDIFAVYNQPYSVKLVGDRSLLAMVVVSSEYGEITLTPESGVDWNKISTNTTYFGDGRIPPSQITVKFFFKDDFDDVLPANMFQDIEHVETFEVRDRITTLSPETFKNNTDLTDVKLYSGVTGYSGTVHSGTSVGNVYYSMPNAVAVNCPNLHRFYGDSPLIVTGAPNASAMLAYNNMLIGVVQYLSITDYYIPDGITGLSSYVFSTKHDYPTVTGISIPDSVVTIGDYCFRNQSNISALTLSSGLTSIGSGAFSACTDLLSITCNATTAPPVNNYTFSGISTGGTLYYPQESDYSSWFIQSNDSRLLDYYSWRDGVPPVMTIEPQTVFFAGSGGTNSIVITANKLGWHLYNSETWFTLNSLPATGETTHQIVCYENTSDFKRTGSVYVLYNDETAYTINVVQYEAVSILPIIEVDRDLVWLPYSGNSLNGSAWSDGIFRLTANTSFQVVKSNWINRVAGTTGKTASAYTGQTSVHAYSGSSRTGNVDFVYRGYTYQSLFVFQNSSGLLTMRPDGYVFSSNEIGSNYKKKLIIYSVINYKYSISDNDNWLTVEGLEGSSGTCSSGTTVITFYPNTPNTGETKYANISLFTGNTPTNWIENVGFTLYNDTCPSITFTPTALTFSSGVTSQTFEVNCDSSYFEFTTTTDWISVSPTWSHTSPRTITVTVGNYYDNSTTPRREGYIQLKIGNKVRKSIKVIQETKWV